MVYTFGHLILYTQTLHGTAIYAAPLTPQNHSNVIIGIGMAVPWVVSGIKHICVGGSFGWNSLGISGGHPFSPSSSIREPIQAIHVGDPRRIYYDLGRSSSVPSTSANIPTENAGPWDPKNRTVWWYKCSARCGNR